ncbi:MAG: hypothetical protein H6668_01410 [Ardenticatenaceae bacterium]|nr:hypothetical protein [Ardenticatenaceae bacterium]
MPRHDQCQCGGCAAALSFVLRFQTVEVADFDDKQAEDFIYHWFEDWEKAEACWNELRAEKTNDCRGGANADAAEVALFGV